MAENNEEELELELEIITEKVDRLVNEDIDFQVTADDEGVEDVTISYNDEEVVTDAGGNATLTFDEAGTWTLTAEKENYVNDSVELTVWTNSTEMDLDLEVLTDQDDWVEGEELTFHVTADNESVENATVSFNDQQAVTDAGGNATLTFDEAGTFEVTAEKDDETVDNELFVYNDATVEVEIEETPGFTVILALIALVGALAAVLIVRNRTRS
ncbi:hypothetical protein [Methanonatronarchaeum sp. AMET-Sl]|uniref:hypothetical protein n=1 Tax=Methanonatronarchaeum sp. AMET-Sl TaxID=3037654 RepID=UPI00244DEC66|nr:hypothetical protein [Methanonatronarchaeum sp. AMET-Sl]WGI17176.1 hypothetical protein QEN48_06650 [Methanonatronarchaeum sp. AMET-Sl]